MVRIRPQYQVGLPFHTTCKIKVLLNNQCTDHSAGIVARE